jgi:hypothetical protein
MYSLIANFGKIKKIKNSDASAVAKNDFPA